MITSTTYKRNEDTTMPVTQSAPAEDPQQSTKHTMPRHHVNIKFVILTILMWVFILAGVFFSLVTIAGLIKMIQHFDGIGLGAFLVSAAITGLFMFAAIRCKQEINKSKMRGSGE